MKDENLLIKSKCLQYRLFFVDINISDEYNCIILLCSLLGSCDNLVVAIDSNTNTLKFQ